MKKENVMKLFSKLIVVTLAIIMAHSVIEVDALNVRETAGREIADGSYIIGITRFTNDVNITAKRVISATRNDMFYKGMSNYQEPVIYQYIFGQWIQYDKDNDPIQLSDEEVHRLGLNNQDIFYENNVEKVLDVSYNRVDVIGELTFITDAEGKSISYTDGIMKVPATTKTITIKDGDSVIEILKKSYFIDDGEFDYVIDTATS